MEKEEIYRYIIKGLIPKPVTGKSKKPDFSEKHLAILRRICELNEREGLGPERRRDPLNPEKRKGEFGLGNRDQSKKEEIMDMAIALFSRNGFAETKVSDITDAVGVAKGTFYLYFKSKKDLFLECIGRLTMIIIPAELWERVRREPDFVQRQRMRLRQFLAAFPTFSGILNLLRLSFQSEDRELANKARDTYKLLAGPLMKDLRRAIADGEAREVDVEVASLLLMGMAENLGYLTMMDPLHSTEEAEEILLDFMRRGLLLPAAGKAEESEKRWALTDKSGLVVHLEDLRIDGNAYIAGNIGEGQVRAATEDLIRVEVHGKGETTRAVVTTISGDRVSLVVDREVVILGKSSLGEYSIPLKRVSNLFLLGISRSN